MRHHLRWGFLEAQPNMQLYEHCLLKMGSQMKRQGGSKRGEIAEQGVVPLECSIILVLWGAPEGEPRSTELATIRQGSISVCHWF